MVHKYQKVKPAPPTPDSRRLVSSWPKITNSGVIRFIDLHTVDKHQKVTLAVAPHFKQVIVAAGEGAKAARLLWKAACGECSRSERHNADFFLGSVDFISLVVRTDIKKTYCFIDHIRTVMTKQNLVVTFFATDSAIAVNDDKILCHWNTE